MAKVFTATENFYQNPKKFSVRKMRGSAKKFNRAPKATEKKLDMATKFSIELTKKSVLVNFSGYKMFFEVIL